MDAIKRLEMYPKSRKKNNPHREIKSFGSGVDRLIEIDWFDFFN